MWPNPILNGKLFLCSVLKFCVYQDIILKDRFCLSVALKQDKLTWKWPFFHQISLLLADINQTTKTILETSRKEKKTRLKFTESNQELTRLAVLDKANVHCFLELFWLASAEVMLISQRKCWVGKLNWNAR